MTEGRTAPNEVDRPDLQAWRVTNGDGTTDRIIVSELHFTQEDRIEIDPDDLISDPDATGEA